MHPTLSAAQSGTEIKIDMLKGSPSMECVRKVDFAAIAKSGANEA
jgi:hypothetical protein